MMSIIGSMEPFDTKQGQFDSYMERLEQYFIVNSIVEAKQKAVLITLIGSETYEVLKNLISPSKPKEVSYDTIVQVLTKHLCQKKNVTTERYHFYKRDQKEGESVSEFIIELILNWLLVVSLAVF